MSLDELRADSQTIVDKGAAKYGLALDSGFDSGGGWYIEQWFCKAQEFYVDGDNGRTSRATKVLFDNDTATNLLTIQTTSDNIRLNGAVTLHTDVRLDTDHTDDDTSGGEILFTANSPIVSATGEYNDLTLDAGINRLSRGIGKACVVLTTTLNKQLSRCAVVCGS